MNELRREKLRGAVRTLSDVQAMVQSVCDKEEDCMDNYPENLQGSERFEQMEAAVDSLNDALEKIDDAKGHIESVIR